MPLKRNWCLTPIIVLLAASAGAQTPAPKPGSKDHKQIQKLLAKVEPSKELKDGWTVETDAYIVHSTISKEYTAAAAAHLDRFRDRFVSIFREDFKDTRKAKAYAFATEKQYLQFSPDSKGTQGRFRSQYKSEGMQKYLAWFSTPAGEKDLYKTDVQVVQHEATHQLLDAYTDNQGIPSWFHEGCATFFESWNLDRSNKDNILSGLGKDYALSICLSYPKQKPSPPLAEHWIESKDVLNLESFTRPSNPNLWTPERKGPPDTVKEQIHWQQEYSEAWCAMTFLIHHPKGQEVFKLLVGELRNRGGLEDIRAKYYTDAFLKSFDVEWRKFIEKEVLRKWELPSAGGKKVHPADSRTPPADTKGFALTEDRRGDLFLVDATQPRELAAGDGKVNVWLMKAWSIPLEFYDDAWKQAERELSGQPVHIIGGLYSLTLFTLSGEHEGKALLLMPLLGCPKEDDAFRKRLTDAVNALIKTPVK